MATTVALGVGAALLAAACLLALSGQDVGAIRAGMRRTNAVVTAVNANVGGSTGPTASIDFSYTDETGLVRTSHLEPVRPDKNLFVGATIEVDYEERNPTRVSVVGHEGEGSAVPWFVPLGFGMMLLVLGALATVRLRWTTSVLRSNPWVVARSEVFELALDSGVRRQVVRMLELRGAPDEIVSLTEPVALRARTLDHLAPEAWVAGAERRFLVASPGGGGILRFRRVRLVHDAGADPRFTPLRSRLGRD